MIDYFEDLKKIISDQFGIPQEDIEEDSTLEEDLKITDLDMEDLISIIEDKYQVQISPDKISSLKKVADFVNFLYENVDNPL